MNAPSPPLSSSQQGRLREILEAFDRGWDEQALARHAARLPAVGDPLRLPLLAGLVRIDLARQWQRGRRAVLEAYLKLYPELAPVLPFELVRHEYKLRQRHGAAPDPAVFAKRFPAHADALRSWLLATDTKDTRHTPPPAPPAKPAAPPVVDEMSGQFGRYRILRMLGSGGMGAVYLAHDTHLDRPVALKVPHRRAGELSPDVRARFLREARLAATLQHPNLCPVFDAGEHDGRCFVTMAYLEGKPLSDLIRGDRKLPPRGTAAVVRKLALALAAAHDKGVVHRDLKPANVMITRANEPVILDFGLARRLGDEQRLTREGAVIGTPAYLAPEQLGRDGEASGPSVDVYGLGVILYEMLTGEVPFQSTSLAALLTQIVTQPPTPPTKLRPDLDPELAALCLKALAKKPAERYPSMRAFADALSAYLQKKPAAAAKDAPATPAAPAAVKEPVPLPVTEEPGSGSELLQRLAAKLDKLSDTAVVPVPPPASHSRALLLGMAAAAVLLTGGALLAWFLLRGGKGGDDATNPGEHRPPPQTVSVQLGNTYQYFDQSTNFFLDGRPISREALDRPLDLPPGEHQLKAVKDGKEIEVRRFQVQPRNNPRRIVVPPPPEPDELNGAVGEVRRYLGHGTPVKTVLFVPRTGGRQFLSMGVVSVYDASIMLWDVGSTKEVGVWSGGNRPHAMAVAPDGGQVLANWYVHPYMTVKRWDLRARKELAQLGPSSDPNGVIQVAYSPDGRRALLSRSDTGFTAIWDLTTNTEGERLEGDLACYTPDGTRIVSAKQGTGTLRLWDAERVREIGVFDPPHKGSVKDLAVSPDGERVVSVGGDGAVHVYDVASRKAVQVIEPPTDVRPAEGAAVTLCVAVSPDGQRLLTGHGDGSVRLWNVADGKELHCFGGPNGHTGPVLGVAYSPGGRRALSCGVDKAIRLWQLPK